MIKGIYEVPNSFTYDRLTVYKEGSKYVAYNNYGEAVYSKSTLKELKEVLSYPGYKKAKYTPEEIKRYGYVKK